MGYTMDWDMLAQVGRRCLQRAARARDRSYPRRAEDSDALPLEV
jgi:hypothetical protein